MCRSGWTGETTDAQFVTRAVQERAALEERYDNQPARGSIRMGAAADRCLPRHLVRLPGGKCGDVVPKGGWRVAHDEFHRVSPLDRADADGDDAARFSRGLPRWGARRYREPPPPAARHAGSDPGRCRRTQHPDLYRAHERAPVAGLHLRTRPWRDPGESGLASG